MPAPGEATSQYFREDATLQRSRVLASSREFVTTARKGTRLGLRRQTPRHGADSLGSRCQTLVTDTSLRERESRAFDSGVEVPDTS
jgi:hypothetical protein